MKNNPQDEGTGLEPDRDEALWKLLGRSRRVEVSPFFGRRILRDLEAGTTTAPGWVAWLRPGWALAGGVAAVVLSLGVWSFSSLPAGPSAPLTDSHPLASLQIVEPVLALVAPAVVAPAPVEPAPRRTAIMAAAEDYGPQDVEVIADLDNAVAREETNVWTDETSRF